MSDLNPTQFQQLPLFMSAREIKSTHSPVDRLKIPLGLHERRPETDEEVWDRKGYEASMAPTPSDRSLREIAVKNNGRQVRPMSLDPTTEPPTVVGGHHRIAVMDRTFPDTLMPVVHHEGIKAAKASKEYPYS